MGIPRYTTRTLQQCWVIYLSIKPAIVVSGPEGATAVAALSTAAHRTRDELAPDAASLGAVALLSEQVLDHTVAAARRTDARPVERP